MSMVIRSSLAACALFAGIAASAAQTGGSSISGSPSAGSISGSPSSRGSIRRGTAGHQPSPSGGNIGANPAQQPSTGTTQLPQPTQSPGAGTATQGSGQELHPIQRDPQSAEPALPTQTEQHTLGSGGKPAGGSASGEAQDDANAAGEGKAGGSLLILTEKEREKVRSVILSYSIAPPENVNTPLRLGAIVPTNVPLKPLPPEVAKIVPDHKNYSYVVARNQIAIVITDKREIDLLIPG